MLEEFVEHNGIIGNTLINAYNIGKITGGSYSGGIVGAIYNNSKMNNFVNIGTVDKNSGGDKISDICGDWGTGVEWENGTWIESKDLDEDGLRAWTDEEIKNRLGNNFAKDSKGGLPILSWQTD